MTAHRRAGPAVDAALKAAGESIRPQDAAAVQLARNYARLLDAPAPAGKYAKAVAWLENMRGLEPKQEELRLIILIALAEQTVASDLGPKLLAVLDQLGITPAARSKLSGRGVAATAAPVESAHERLIRERDELAARRAGRGS